MACRRTVLCGRVEHAQLHARREQTAHRAVNVVHRNKPAGPPHSMAPSSLTAASGQVQMMSIPDLTASAMAWGIVST